MYGNEILRLFGTLPNLPVAQVKRFPLSLAFVDSLEPLGVITKSIPATKLQLLEGGLFAVISKWDERCPVSKRVPKLCFLRNPKSQE